ncbi:MAG: GNAT family N-acetyltransferase [Dehalococcoidales bacterium]
MNNGNFTKSIGRKIAFFRTRTRVSVRDFGVWHTIFRGIMDIIFGKIFVYRKYIVYEKQLTPSAAPEIRNPAIQFSFLTANDSGMMAQIEDMSAISRDFIAERIGRTGFCIVAKNKESLAGFNLVSTGRTRIRYLNVVLNLAESDAWSEQITVSKEYRRGGLASDLRQMMFAHLAGRGYKRLIGGYVPFNVKSGLLARKLGFVETEKLTLLRIFGWKKLSRQSLVPGRAPALLLDTKSR